MVAASGSRSFRGAASGLDPFRGACRVVRGAGRAARLRGARQVDLVRGYIRATPWVAVRVCGAGCRFLLGSPPHWALMARRRPREVDSWCRPGRGVRSGHRRMHPESVEGPGRAFTACQAGRTCSRDGRGPGPSGIRACLRAVWAWFRRGCDGCGPGADARSGWSEAERGVGVVHTRTRATARLAVLIDVGRKERAVGVSCALFEAGSGPCSGCGPAKDARWRGPRRGAMWARRGIRCGGRSRSDARRDQVSGGSVGTRGSVGRRGRFARGIGSAIGVGWQAGSNGRLA